MKVQPHTLNTLLAGYSPNYPFNMMMGGPQSGYGRFQEETSLLNLPANYRCFIRPVRGLVTTLTELSPSRSLNFCLS